MALAPLSLGHNLKIANDKTIVEDYNRYLYPEYYDSYSIDEIPENIRPYISNNDEEIQDISNSEIISHKETPQPLDGPMDSSWPMYCHDTHHTGRSPYSTVDTWDEVWRLGTIGWAGGGSAIDENGTIYIGSHYLDAVYPNGTLKWKYYAGGPIQCTPAIDENGVIYVGPTYGDDNLYAINPDGTLKWRYWVGLDIFSSPAIGDDGVIYFGGGGDYPARGNINAVYPNGTLKWKYDTNHVVYSSPAIGDDGTIYCGCHDEYLYALYPNNGTLKWKGKTGHWIRTAPCIGDDGNIYVVSLDGHIHAFAPNGTKKWSTDVGAGTSPTMGQDGTIYAGYRTLHAINPVDGSVKWTFNVDGAIGGGTPCNSIDGTIYFGTTDNGQIYSITSDGTERWRKTIGKYIDSPPAIGSDGTVYIGSSQAPGEGYLHAFGELDTNAPSEPQINGQTSGKPGNEYDYTFKSTSPLGNDVYYWIEWGDGATEEWIGPYDSGEVITRSHTWSDQGTYTIKARAKDSDNLWGPWGELEVTMPRNKASYNLLFLRFLEQFPLLEEFISRIISPLRWV